MGKNARSASTRPKSRVNGLVSSILLGLGLITFSGPAWTSEPEKPSSKEEWVVLKIKGMTCASCEFQVKRALKKVPGVKEARPSADSGNARVLYDTTKASPEKLVEAVNKAGYKASLPDRGRADE